MNAPQLHIYRELYSEKLMDIWDKISEVLESCGLDRARAEHAGLLVTEWIRANWGGLILSERHLGDPLNTSRFRALSEQVVFVLVQTAPDVVKPEPVSHDVARIIRNDYLGVYIPRVAALDNIRRDHEIWSQANTPAQIEEIARLHGITVVRVYQINKAFQKQKDRHEQPTLF